MAANDEHENRLAAMAIDEGLTWDLSPSDRAALAWAVGELPRLRAERDGAVAGCVTQLYGRWYACLGWCPGKTADGRACFAPNVEGFATREEAVAAVRKAAGLGQEGGAA